MITQNINHFNENSNNIQENYEYNIVLEVNIVNQIDIYNKAYDELMLE